MSAKIRKGRQERPTIDIDALVAELQSPDAQIRLKALHKSCPCSSGFRVYEQVRNQVKQLQKDPDPQVRQVALHVVQDACEIERKESDLDRADELGVRVGDAGWTAAQRRRQATGTWEPL